MSRGPAIPRPRRSSGDRATDTQLDELARDGLGIDELHPAQRRAVRAAVEGRDVLAVMPTGSGKSAIYQLAAALIEGPTVVVSPLLALQYDQIEFLSTAAVGDAVAVNSRLTDAQRAAAFDRLAGGELEFVFVAPEQLARGDTREALVAARPSLFVVDEAHCISSWGHDFRPDYLRLGAVLAELGHPAVIALTATAAPPVQREIIERLALRDPLVLVEGFDRPNVALSVHRFEDAGAKDDAVVEEVANRAQDGSAVIVYVATRRRTELLAEAITARGVAAQAYHGAMGSAERTNVHDEFMAGDVPVVVATTAFGMGVDKPDVRLVAHADVPDSLDDYHQEIGRAGRDGRPAEAMLFYRPADLGRWHAPTSSGGVRPADVAEVSDVLVERGGGLTEDDLREETDLDGRRLTLALDQLERSADGVVVDADRTVHVDPDSIGDPVADAERAREERRSLDRSRMEMVRGYAETTTCRRRHLIAYFGADAPARCGNCDNCRKGRSVESGGGRSDGVHPVGSRVVHPTFGPGQVLSADDDVTVVLFDGGGYRTLSTELVEARDLLAREGEGDPGGTRLVAPPDPPH